ncbi:MAG: hypothetical protein WCG75_12940 [Armatimonadota bacterium]
MKRQIWLIGIFGALLSLGGCSPTESSSEIPNVNKALSTLVPEYTELSKVRLPNGRRYVSLGDTEERATAVFPQPSRGFSPKEDTVPVLPQDFKSKVWETTQEGFGIILHDDKVVMAMHQYDGITADEFASILDNVKAVNGIDHFQGLNADKVDYWFTRFGIDLIVISRVAGNKMKYQTTIAIGNEHIFDTLGILKNVKKIEYSPNSPKT